MEMKQAALGLDFGFLCMFFLSLCGFSTGFLLPMAVGILPQGVNEYVNELRLVLQVFSFIL